MAETTVQRIFSITQSEAFRHKLAETLLALCQIDTTPKANPEAMREAESACFSILEARLTPQPLAAALLERRPIPPAIASHPAYTPPYFTSTPHMPQGLDPETLYSSRSNLVFLAKGPDGPGPALNAHIDTVAPVFSPRREEGVVFGRGACDDKGNAAAIAAGLTALGQALAASGERLAKSVTAMFVVEEETGGNGSLALATDAELRRHFESVLVAECTSGRVHPANRGAVWHQIEFAFEDVFNLEVCAFVVEELDREGRRLRAESSHPLFPHRPVQTCHGILGPFGEHPSRTCGEVALRVRFPSTPPHEAEAMARKCIEKGMREYEAEIRERARSASGEDASPLGPSQESVPPFSAVENGGKAFGSAEPAAIRLSAGDGGAVGLCKRERDIVVRVRGDAGHMGAAASGISAIALAASIVRALARCKARLSQTSGGEIELHLEGADTGAPLTLEGGQGFLPTHSLAEVKERMASAARRGAERCLRLAGSKNDAAPRLRVSFGKLHNDAFATDPDSRPMRHAARAAQACGLWDGKPTVGWDVSCDARLFAAECPGMPVLTAGAGELAVAHSDAERIDLDVLAQAAAFFAVYLYLEAAPD